MKWLSMLAILAGLGGYAYFGVFKEDIEQTRLQKVLFASDELTRLEKIKMSTADADVEVEKREGQWWVVQPEEYLANQDYVEKTLKIMESAQATSWFQLSDDRYGLHPGRAIYQLSYDDQRQRRLIIGSEEGPAESLYVLDKDENTVYVVHNVWAQFLYFPVSRFYHEHLPIPGTLVKNVGLYQGEKNLWKVDPEKGGKMKVLWEGKEFQSDRAPFLWFFNKLRELPLKNIEFKVDKKTLKGPELRIETNLGNISFHFSEKRSHIYIPRLNVFAEVDPHSLKSLGNEIKKVIKSDKK